MFQNIKLKRLLTTGRQPFNIQSRRIIYERRIGKIETRTVCCGAEADRSQAQGEAIESELKRLTRSERTHRLCTRAEMLETFLKEPTVLTDEDVMELLTFIFQSEAVQKKLNLLIESRRETQETDEGKNP